jgi:hypothetical protein
MPAMSQFTPPEDAYSSEPAAPYPEAPYPPQPAPMSTAAVTGFISSLVFCIPLVTQLLGLILGIVGITKTSAGRARGRGLAIAAVVISLAASAVWLLVGATLVPIMLAMLSIAGDIRPLLEADHAELPTIVNRLYEGSFSERLKQRVSERDVVGYIERVHQTYGDLKGLGSSSQLWQATSSESADLALTGRFTNGTVGVRVTLGLGGSNLEIDNITVGDLVLAPDQ